MHNNSLEVHFAEIVKGRVAKLIRQGMAVGRRKARNKRNIIGTLLHDIGGVCTTLTVEK
jgi:hypothetical protein